MQNRYDGTDPIAFIPVVGKDRKRENGIGPMDTEGLQRLFFRVSLFRFGSSYGDIGVMLKCGWVVVLQVACWMLLAKQGAREHHDAAQRDERVD